MKEQQKFYLLYALIALTTLPFLLIVKTPLSWALTADNAHNIALYVSAFCGYIGVSLLLWMFILGTRSVTGLYFNDLPKSLKVHRQLGTYGVLFIFLHPLFIAYSYGMNVLTYTFWPSISTSFEKNVTLGRFALEIMLIVWFTSAIVRGRISFRPWKYTHYLSYAALPLSFLHVPEIGSSFSQQAVQFYWYSFIVVFLVFLVLRMRHLFGYGKVSYEVTDHSQINDDVFVLALRTLGKKLEVRTGQYVYLQRSLYSEEHPFTVLDYNNRTGEMTIAYKVYGAYTQKMTDISHLDTVLLDGPYGVFTQDIPVNNKPSVFIAGGIGVTPFVRHIMNDPNNTSWLFYANQTKKSAVFRDYLQNKMGSHYIDVLSRESTEADHRSERGRLTTQTITKYIQNPNDYLYYVCGPSGLVESAKQSLLGAGVHAQHIHAEEFSF